MRIHLVPFLTLSVILHALLLGGFGWRMSGRLSPTAGWKRGRITFLEATAHEGDSRSMNRRGRDPSVSPQDDNSKPQDESFCYPDRSEGCRDNKERASSRGEGAQDDETASTEIRGIDRPLVFLTENNPPSYPREAIEAGFEGTVLLKIEVLPTGKTGVIAFLSSSGYDVLDEAALESAKKWRFEPARMGDMAALVWVKIPIQFKLE